jgi:hypothetical protein
VARYDPETKDVPEYIIAPVTVPIFVLVAASRRILRGHPNRRHHPRWRDHNGATCRIGSARHLTYAPAPPQAACDMIATAADPARHVLWPTNPYVLLAPPSPAFESFDRMTALPRG